MKTSAQARARTLFVLLLLALAAGAAGWALLARGQMRSYELRTRDAVSGLIPGAPVEFHGVEVGRVDAVQLRNAREVRVRIAVRRDVPVTSATVATITGRGLATRGFTGYVYVALEEGADGGRPLAEAADGSDPVIATAPSQLAGMDTAVAELNRNMQAVTALLQSTLDPQTVASLKRALADLDQVTGTLAAHDAQLARILANAEGASAGLSPLLRSSSDAVQSLRTQVLPQAQQAVAHMDGLSAAMNERMGTILHNTEQASTRVGPLLEASNEAVRSLQADLLPEAHRTLARLDHLSAALGQSADRIRRDPSLLLRRAAPVPAGPGEAP